MGKRRRIRLLGRPIEPRGVMGVLDGLVYCGECKHRMYLAVRGGEVYVHFEDLTPEEIVYKFGEMLVCPDCGGAMLWSESQQMYLHEEDLSQDDINSLLQHGWQHEREKGG